jgi:hypothetical protein
MGYSGAWGPLIYEKNLMSKISCQTPFLNLGFMFQVDYILYIVQGGHFILLAEISNDKLLKVCWLVPSNFPICTCIQYKVIK